MTMKLTILFASFLIISGAAQAQDLVKPEKKALKPTLLVIDVQNVYIPMMSEADQKIAPKYINGAIWLFRQYNLPVIRVHHTDPKWGPEPGSEDFAFPETINTEESDPQVIKNYPSAFTKTNLDSILQVKGCNTLFICGLSATGCALATYYGGIDRGYEVFMFKNGLLSHDADLTGAVEEITQAISWEAMNLLLETSQ